MKTDKFTLFVYCNFLVLLSTTVCSQNINTQIVNIADETLTDYSFLIRYHYTKSKNYLKRRYRIRHWIPMFFGTPCSINITFKSLIHMFFFLTFLYCTTHLLPGSLKQKLSVNRIYERKKIVSHQTFLSNLSNLNILLLERRKKVWYCRECGQVYQCKYEHQEHIR